VHPRGSHAIDVPARLVVAERRRVDPGTVIHEMGHVFLAEGDPDGTYEPNWLGWEIALARRARCYWPWSAQCADYQLLEGDIARDWRDFRGAELRRKIAECIDEAKSLGVVSEEGAPLCTRPRAPRPVRGGDDARGVDAG
jgi:hypothetical protein